jgi:hypothetical protein
LIENEGFPLHPNDAKDMYFIICGRCDPNGRNLSGAGQRYEDYNSDSLITLGII